METVVMYHTRCFDGTMAAAAALQAIRDHKLDCDPEKGLIPINYSQATFEAFFSEGGHFSKYQELGADRIIFLDFCPALETLNHLLELETSVVILDHHKTAKKNLEGRVHNEGHEHDLVVHFDMTKSGARMAWDYFHEEVPDLALHVEDRDLWNWKMRGTREVMAWLSAVAETDNPQSYLDAIQEFKFEDYQCKQIGSYLCKEMDKQIEKMASAFRYVEFQGFGMGIVVNATCYPSEVCEYLYSRHEVPFVIAYHSTRGGDVALSFRSEKDAAHAIDVTTLAAQFEGGGHPSAAGGVASLEYWTEILEGTLHQGYKKDI